MAITLNSVLQRKSLRLEKVKDLAHGCTDSKWLSQNANPVGTVHTVVLAEPKNLANRVPEVLDVIMHQNPLEGLLKQIAGSHP